MNEGAGSASRLNGASADFVVVMDGKEVQKKKKKREE
jgi:hypothetical protein